MVDPDPASFNGETAPRRRGRPAKARAETEDTRASILAAAAAEFSRDGYEATSMRGVARAAGVDPALVRHYFNDKADLFGEAIAVPMRPDRLVATALRGPRERVGENLVRYIVTTLDDPATSRRVVSMMQTALGQEFAAGMFREFLIREVLKRIATELLDDEAELRASFAASQVVGLVIARYGLRIEPLASATPDEVVARIGPVVQWHLMGNPLPG
jgi:AcrR family transcriptional regulator